MTVSTVESRWQHRLSLKQLRLVSVLGEELNLSRCALRLYTTQPATSRLLAQTESLVGCRLFERTTKRVVPTAAGHSLIQRANRILGELDLAAQDIRSAGRAARSELRIGMINVFSATVLARAMTRFRGQMPMVALRAVVLPVEALYEQLLGGAIDLMLSHAELRVDLNRVEVLPLYEERNVVLAAPDSKLARKRKPGWEELAQSAWVLPSASTPLRPKLERMLSVHRRRDAQVVDVETDSPALALQLVRQNSMLWAIASRQATDLLARGEVALVNAPQALIMGPICCMRLHDAAGVDENQRLIDCLREAAQRAP